RDRRPRIFSLSFDNIKYDTFEIEEYPLSAQGFDWELWCRYLNPPKAWWSQANNTAPIRSGRHTHKHTRPTPLPPSDQEDTHTHTHSLTHTHTHTHTHTWLMCLSLSMIWLMTGSGRVFRESEPWETLTRSRTGSLEEGSHAHTRAHTHTHTHTHAHTCRHKTHNSQNHIRLCFLSER